MLIVVKWNFQLKQQEQGVNLLLKNLRVLHLLLKPKNKQELHQVINHLIILPKSSYNLVKSFHKKNYNKLFLQ